MARYIDAELFADRLLNAWDTADKEKKTEIVAILSDIVTPILVGTPTDDVAPRAEVAREIFEEIEDVLNNIGYFDELDFEALKNKYAEVQK